MRIMLKTQTITRTETVDSGLEPSRIERKEPRRFPAAGADNSDIRLDYGTNGQLSRVYEHERS